MKKVFLFLITMSIMIMTGVCAYAADYDVKTTSLPSGKAYEPYSAQIEMAAGNDGYTFEFATGVKPKGLTINSDGSITGIPTTAGCFPYMCVRISHTDGTSKIVNFNLRIDLRSIQVEVTAPKNVVYDGNGHTAQIKCFDMDGNELNDMTPVVRYGIYNLASAVNAGSYYIDVYVSGCKIEKREGDLYLEIARKEGATVTLSGDKHFPYDQKPHPLTASDITVTPSGISYAIEYSKNGGEYTADEPVASGTYKARVYTTDSNYVWAWAECLITIEGSSINFDVTDTQYTYDGQPHFPTITADTDGVPYTVTYTNSKGETVASPTNADTYTITITLNDSSVYSIGNTYKNKLVINPKKVEITFDETQFTYDGQKHNPVLKTEDGVTIDTTLTAKYYNTDKDEYVDDIIDAGEYTVIYEFGTGNYVADNGSIYGEAVTVSFNVADNVKDYDGQTHTATITLLNAIADGHYTVKYRKQGSTELLDNVRNSGVYDIVITFDSNNFFLQPSFAETMTINTTYTMNYGNSPAAMIYRDDTKSNEWKDASLEYLKNNKKFDAEHLPKGCVANIPYESLRNISVDLDPYTVITNSLDHFNDPGIQVNNGSENDVIKGKVEQSTEDTSLYNVVYTVGDKTYKRSLIIVGRTGDVNFDNAVNNIDANALVGKNQTVDTLVQARMWDVTMDGRINDDDAAAIRNRFKEKIQSYYPWL